MLVVNEVAKRSDWKDARTMVLQAGLDVRDIAIAYDFKFEITDKKRAKYRKLMSRINDEIARRQYDYFG